MITVMSVLFGIYLIGVIILSMYLFSNVQEWFIDLLEEVKDMDWGIK
jgi:hypothetical protein